MRVVVVGAGILGASVAYHLACRDVPVTLVEQGPGPATGVTGDSFAWIGGTTGGDWPGGAEDLRPAVLADWRRLEREVPGVMVRRTGSLTWPVPYGPGGGRLPEGRHPVGRTAIQALEPHFRTPPDAAVHTPSDAGVDPVAVTAALVAAARARGARVGYEAAGAVLRTETGRVTGVDTAAGFRPASVVVLAAGTGAVELAAPLGTALPVIGSPARLLRLAAPPGLVRSVVAGPDFEVREVSAGRLLLTRTRADDDTAVAGLRASFEGEFRVVGSRVGVRPIPEGGPLIGPLTPDGSAYVAVAHSAVTLAPTVGRLVAAELATGQAAPELGRCRLPRT
ncbi:NAD(P)/FAD-dependent oxidoreductase [Streptomyces hyaluromycini]|uniref:NAD(P)/FAD-dependent oxidoreductase n=1 Tax=Streptomyces hyaluromycini TaxID=1377993 RepID=UPI000B5C5A71|nr:FAD-dependent oxidoreductase [Streptomyces hyaluromycini]